MDNNFDTLAIREGYKRTEEREHSDAIFLTSSFVFDSAEQAEKCFAKKISGNIYSRFTNPNVTAFEKKLASLEKSQACAATSSGMAAIFATIMSIVKSGDHIVASREMFGTTIVLLNTIVAKFNIDIDYVELSDLSGWQSAVRKNTKLFLLENPSNPLTSVVDVAKLSKISKNHNILLAIDNVILTPFLHKPITLGADIVIHSATKYIDGQGRCIAGAVLGDDNTIDKVHSFIRSTGSCLSPFNAWVISKGLETLGLRMRAHCNNAMKIANWLESQDKVKKVYYLGLNSHHHHKIAKKQQSDFGAIISFTIDGGKKAAFNFINSVDIISITANLGDAKTTINHPASTTHSRLTKQEKEKANISDDLIRISVGLEDVNDLIKSLKKGLYV
jgi:O-succinylhomoserine sulfhydrylase